jgi:glyoxylase-like metal-dependent hydrolase (beta-lactamase superfamily II)
MGSGVRRIVALTLGWEEMPKSVSVHGAPPDLRLREPVPGVLLEVDGGWVLLDTGFNTALIRDPALARRFHPGGHYAPVLPGPGEPLEETMAEVGLDLADVHAVAVSHLHLDHAGGLKHFAGRVPVHAQRAEVEYGLSNHPEPERHGIYRVDFDDPRIDWRLAGGDRRAHAGAHARAPELRRRAG